IPKRSESHLTDLLGGRAGEAENPAFATVSINEKPKPVTVAKSFAGPRSSPAELLVPSPGSLQGPGSVRLIPRPIQRPFHGYWHTLADIGKCPWKKSPNISEASVTCMDVGGCRWRVRWRKGWDSNPRCPCRHAGFQDRCLKPLGHPSAGSGFNHFEG